MLISDRVVGTQGSAGQGSQQGNLAPDGGLWWDRAWSGREQRDCEPRNKMSGCPLMDCGGHGVKGWEARHGRLRSASGERQRRPYCQHCTPRDKGCQFCPWWEEGKHLSCLDAYFDRPSRSFSGGMSPSSLSPTGLPTPGPQLFPEEREYF